MKKSHSKEIAKFFCLVFITGILIFNSGGVSDAKAAAVPDSDDTYEEFDPTVAEEYVELPDVPEAQFFLAKIIEVLDERVEEIPGGYVEEVQEVRVEITSGQEKGNVLTLSHGGIVTVDQYQKVEPGDKVILVKTFNADGDAQYYINDHYRLTPMAIVLGIFILLAIFFARWKGVGSILGLGFSILILAQYIVPQIIAGGDPLTITIIGTFLIAGVSLFMAHGYNKRTLVAFGSTMITLIIVLFVSKFFVEFSNLFGRGTEEAMFIQLGQLSYINLRGLLLAGIVIGTLGVLDDITTAQTAVVGELRQANPSLSLKELYRRGLIVGREHIASLVNTLVLAYAGASLPLFILFSFNDQAPIWLKLNSEIIAEEVIRTIIGSTALILAVPIATMLAAYFLRNEKISDQPLSHSHSH
ncbi:MAG: YibE/F family protein [Candidatus Komeilibacteria bacterium]|nr:YibE/F family protein [Candidatus Komeilibacteria bacterium]